MTNQHDTKKRNRRTLLLIFCIPLFVLLTSTSLYYLANEGLIDLGTANKGTLISPVLSVLDMPVTDQTGQAIDYRQGDPLWTFLIVGDRHCDRARERLLYLTRQTHTALGTQAHQVRRLYLNVDPVISEACTALLRNQHADVAVAYVDRQALNRLFFDTPIDPLQADRFFLVDPQGWIMMTYHVDSEQAARLHAVGKDVLKDMKRLLP